MQDRNKKKGLIDFIDEILNDKKVFKQVIKQAFDKIKKDEEN